MEVGLSLLLSCLFSIIFIWVVITQALNNPFKRSKRPTNPPGPKPLPIIGNLLELGNKPHKSLAKLSESYGPIMRLKLGQITTIVISSPASAKQVLKTYDQFLSGRTIPDAARAHAHDEYGFPWIPVSTRWRKLRRICNNHLFSAKALDATQNLRHNKVREFLSDVQESVQAGEAVEIGRAAFTTSLNLLSIAFFSVNFADLSSANDIEGEIKELMWRVLEAIGKPNVADFFPLLKWIDPQGIRRRATVQGGKLVDLFDRVIDERLRARKIAESGYTEEHDMLDTLINMIGEDDGEDDQFNAVKIGHLLIDLFTGGTETTSSTLEWSMAELLKAPEIMSKAKAELEQVIGKGNQVKESDITRLPYLQAIIKETLRLHPLVPLLIPRKAVADVEIWDYTIPKGAQVLVNVWAIGRDPSVWNNPNKFMPERFLESGIDVRGGHFELTPFGGGRRICPGLPLAMRMLHLMLGSLLHSFDWKLEDGVGPHDLNMEDKFGITLQMAQPLRALPMSTI